MKTTTSVLALGLMSLPCLAKEYILYKEGGMPAVGTKLEMTSKTDFPEMKMSVKGGPQAMEGKMSRKSEDTEVIEVKGKGKLHYELKASESQNATEMMGQRQEAPEPPNKLLKTPILFELQGDDWEAKPVNGQLSDEQREAAEDKLEGFLEAGEIYGEKARKVGETWKVEGDELSVLMKDADFDEGGATLTLQEIVTKDGQECAKILVKFDMSGSIEDSGMTMKMEGTGNVVRSLEHLVDLDLDMKMKITMGGEVGPGMSMSMSGEGTMHQTIKLTPAK
ncbi:hypothetical protein [Rubritalea tangerina]|uniref:DUF4412 domain-containing protein n=1 Tax=Rubritalea tangerina TaxID=430798 RepID=A0ABW4ZE09_9BACT